MKAIISKDQLVELIEAQKLDTTRSDDAAHILNALNADGRLNVLFDYVANIADPISSFGFEVSYWSTNISRRIILTADDYQKWHNAEAMADEILRWEKEARRLEASLSKCCIQGR
jgi:hypothetical protein